MLTSFVITLQVWKHNTQNSVCSYLNLQQCMNITSSETIHGLILPAFPSCFSHYHFTYQYSINNAAQITGTVVQNEYVVSTLQTHSLSNDQNDQQHALCYKITFSTSKSLQTNYSLLEDMFRNCQHPHLWYPAQMTTSVTQKSAAQQHLQVIIKL